MQNTAPSPPQTPARQLKALQEVPGAPQKTRKPQHDALIAHPGPVFGDLPEQLQERGRSMTGQPEPGARTEAENKPKAGDKPKGRAKSKAGRKPKAGGVTKAEAQANPNAVDMGQRDLSEAEEGLESRNELESEQQLVDTGDQIDEESANKSAPDSSRSSSRQSTRLKTKPPVDYTKYFSDPYDDEDDFVDANDRIDWLKHHKPLDVGNSTQGTTNIIDLLLREFPPCPPCLAQSHSSNVINPTIEKGDKQSRTRSNSNVSKQVLEDDSEFSHDGQAIQDDDQESIAVTEISADDKLPKLSRVVFVPSMVSLLKEPTKKLIASKHNLNADLSDSMQAARASQILPEWTISGTPQAVRSEFDIQYLCNRMLASPANIALKVICGDAWDRVDFDRVESPGIGSVGGKAHIPDAALMAEELHMIFEYKTPTAFPWKTFLEPNISAECCEPREHCAMCFVWPDEDVPEPQSKERK